MLEAGPEPTIVANYQYPGGNQYLSGNVHNLTTPVLLLNDDLGTAIDYNYYTLPQKNLNNRILPYHRTSIRRLFNQPLLIEV